MDMFIKMVSQTGFANFTSIDNLIMLIIGGVAIYLAIVKKYEPLLLLPIGFGVIAGNIPYAHGLPIGVYDTAEAIGSTQSSVFSYFYAGVTNGLFPPLIFLGIGALTDFSALISSPKSLLLGAAAQFGIFATFLGALALGFTGQQSAAIGIIGGADGPTSIFIASMLAPEILGPIAIAAYSYMALVPVIQPPFMKILTTEKEKRIRMKPSRRVTKTEKIIFPIMAFILSALIAPGSITLVGMFMLGNLCKESGVTERLAKTAGNALLDSATVILSFSVGLSTQANVFLTKESLMIFGLGLASFCVATASGLIFAKVMNLFLKEKINPLIGAAGVSAVPDSARVVHHFALHYDKTNHLLMHAMAPNVAGVIGSAIAAGVFITTYSSVGIG
ncbi:MAG: sodium ion-translocating decarboxylase subunit beta [Candidatus Delongbacteria bacterium]|nr:sodium ion-translocating decarboxylase subunit beta [Candidatus Delongbacteria bacterium]MBN2835757.1 sodium ion-translocating decarboxylase subunit beta [Candidatus Delongbacteria bacterium]